MEQIMKDKIKYKTKEEKKDWKTAGDSTHNALNDAIIQLTELKINIKTAK